MIIAPYNSWAKYPLLTLIIFIDEWIWMNKLNAKLHIKILYWEYIIQFAVFEENHYVCKQVSCDQTGFMRSYYWCFECIMLLLFDFRGEKSRLSMYIFICNFSFGLLMPVLFVQFFSSYCLCPWKEDEILRMNIFLLDL